MEGKKEKTTSTVKSDQPTAEASERQGSVSNCTHHPSQSLDLYCSQCEELICRDCIVFGKKHTSHKYDKVEVIAKNCRREVQQELTSLLQKQPAIARAVGDVCTTQKEIEESREMISTKISESYENAISKVEKKKESELRQFHSEVSAKLKEMETRKESLTSVLSEMNEVRSLVERGIEGLGDVEFMVRKKGMVLKINEMLHRISSLPTGQPAASLHAQVTGSGVAEAIDLRPYRIIDPSLCTATVTRGNEHVQVGVATSASVLLVDSEHHPCLLRQCVTVELYSPKFGKRVSPEVVCQSPSHYEAHYTPTLGTRGHCQLIVKVNGHMIGSGPIKLFIACPPQLLGEPVHIINDILQPGCLRIFNEQMFCYIPRGSCVIDLRDTSASQATFPRGSKLQRCEVAVDKEFGVVYVSEPVNGNTIYKFSTDGQHLKSINRQGSEPGEFNYCNGLCVSGDGLLYVCDSDNSRIQVLDRDLQFVRCLGSHGAAPGQFNYPNTIDFDASGHIYMTDSLNHRIQCLTADGDPIRCIGREGSGPGEFTRPNILEVVGIHIFVTDMKGVSVFTTEGQFISKFATECSAAGRSMDGLTVDEDGFVCVSDASRDRIVVF